MIKTLFISSSSACFEWENNLPYYTKDEYTVYLNGEKIISSNTNVFSIFGLNSDTEYVLTTSLSDDEYSFKTSKDACVVNVRDFGAVGDGVTEDTVYIQTAINCLPKGAKLFFPAGDDKFPYEYS